MGCHTFFWGGGGGGWGGLEDGIALNLFSHHIYCAQSKVKWEGANKGTMG